MYQIDTPLFHELCKVQSIPLYILSHTLKTIYIALLNVVGVTGHVLKWELFQQLYHAMLPCVMKGGASTSVYSHNSIILPRTLKKNYKHL